ncbi:hypothetical protein HDG37_001035 [Paraburkholderia sp. MM5384-R2]|nr:hypothetical protein [Paraburkholderia sp. MM5384-R2]
MTGMSFTCAWGSNEEREAMVAPFPGIYDNV